MARLTGWELEAALSRLGTTTREVADASGIPEPDIARYLTDESLPFSHAARIQRALWRIEAEQLLAEAGLEPCPELAYLTREHHRDPDAIDVHINTCAVCQERAALVQERLGRSPSWLTTTLDAFFGDVGDAPRLLVPVLTGMIVVAALAIIPLGIALVSSVFTGKLGTLVPLFVLTGVALVGGAGAGLVWALTPMFPRAGAPGRYFRAILTMWAGFACFTLALLLWPRAVGAPMGPLASSGFAHALALSPFFGAILGVGMAIGMRSPPRLPEEPTIHTRRGLALYAAGVAVLVLAVVAVRDYVQRETLFAQSVVTQPSSAADDSAPAVASHNTTSSTDLGSVGQDTDLARGVDLARLGKFRAAEPYFRRAVARDTSNAGALQFLAWDLTVQHRGAEGLRLARAGADHRRTDPRFQEMAANVALGVHDFQTAYTYGRRALALDSTDALPWALVAHAAFGTNRMTESDTDYRHVERIDPAFFQRAPFEAQIRDEVQKLVKPQ